MEQRNNNRKTEEKNDGLVDKIVGHKVLHRCGDLYFKNYENFGCIWRHDF